MATIKLAHNAVVAKLVDVDEKIENTVSELLSYLVDGHSMSFAFNQGNWDGRSSFYEYRTHTFPAGFVHTVHAELTRLGHNVLLIRRPHVEPLGPENPIVDEFGNEDPRYDFQLKALRQVEKHGRGIIQVATGGGKSKIAKLIMSRYKRMTLFLTTRGVLLYQMKDQLDAIGLNTGLIGDGELKLVRGVNLGMVQTLVAALAEPDIDAEHRAIVKSLHRSKSKNAALSYDQIREMATKRFNEKAKKRQQILKVLEMIEVVIGEEAHEAGGNSYFEILKHCRNASIRVALTATPFMRDGAEDNMRLMAAFGPILIKVSEALLIKRGILAKPFFKFVDAPPPTRAKAADRLFKSSPWERARQLGYVQNENMHALIVNHAVRAKAVGLPVLTLVVLKDHGEILREKFEAAGLRAVFLKGENDNAERKHWLTELAKGKIDQLIGTNIVDVGVDVPAIGLVQLVGGGKAEVALRQRIGRGLRAKKGMPNFAFIADYSCNFNNKLAEHARQRRSIIEQTEGFAEGILPANQDFDWSIFERKAA
ncbi:DEAD/DEAH box helicase [Mesorhizobium sp.]|uniref:DEAD/DEAH box helicase n=1 Tax=Mesorhizobium sp. TaxID=1871066 RepID=UPI000FE7065C|nr:DEAD/DEAH box helicase [Mesorhizobium sp.]RWI35405.1 MAG: DEAD/DEAH box helicase [Mesorhizobium sp.]RWJ66426.1 MAG: DEAD/DEAH box helicase [Mesorhizobium sp.]